MKKRFVWISAVLLLTMLVVTACGGASGSDGSLDKVKKAGKLVIAVDATYPPMEFLDKDGKTAIGFDVDMAKAIAQKMGVEAQFEVVPWEGILAGLGQRYDVIMSSMNITEERLATANFVEYAKMSQVFVTTGTAVKTEADLAGKKVAVQQDTTSHTWVNEAKDKRGIAVTSISGFPGATDAFMELKNGRADVIVIDEPVGRYYANLEPDVFKITGQAVAPEPIGIAVKKDQKALFDAVQHAFNEVKDEGTYLKLSNDWFGGELGK